MPALKKTTGGQIQARINWRNSTPSMDGITERADQIQLLRGDAHRLEGIAGRFRVDAFPHQLELGEGQGHLIIVEVQDAERGSGVGHGEFNFGTSPSTARLAADHKAVGILR